jgi:hypothetical protein
MTDSVNVVEGRERVLVDRRDLEGENREKAMKLQLACDKIQRVAWIEDLSAPGGWEIMTTFTFRWEASADSARRCFTRWIRRELPGVSFFYALEPNPSRDGHHVHSLWCDCGHVLTKRSGCRDLVRSVEGFDVWRHAFERWGRARVELVESKRDSSDYASKYLCKPNAWYDVHLQSYRWRALGGRPPGELPRRQVLSLVRQHQVGELTPREKCKHQDWQSVHADRAYLAAVKSELDARGLCLIPS